MGAAWDEADVALVKAAIRRSAEAGGTATAAPVILRNDTSVPAPQPPAPGYAEQLIRRMRLALGKLVRGEKLDGPEEGIVVRALFPPSPSPFLSPVTAFYSACLFVWIFRVRLDSMR